MKVGCNNTREPYIDFLKVLSTVAVVVIHTCATVWNDLNPDSGEWIAVHFYDSLVRWCVPVFVMASGMLFLSREFSIKELYGKYISRILLTYICWSFIYACFTSTDSSDLVINTIKGHYHLWFLTMLIGLYMMTPLFKLIIKNESLLYYSIILLFIFVVLLPTTINVWKIFYGQNKLTDTVESFLIGINPFAGLSFLVYFLLGYFFHVHEFSKKQRCWIYCLGILGFIVTFFGTMVVIRCCNHEYKTIFYDYLSLNVFAMASAIFLRIKSTSTSNTRLNVALEYISNKCFIIYLVHPMIIKAMNQLIGINVMSFQPVLSVMIISVIVFICSFCISVGIHTAWIGMRQMVSE